MSSTPQLAFLGFGRAPAEAELAPLVAAKLVVMGSAGLDVPRREADVPGREADMEVVRDGAKVRPRWRDSVTLCTPKT